MKGTEHFKQTIKEYLDGRAQTDELFAVSYAKENKNLDDCITFILNQVKASGCCGMTDDEVWSLAIHYYDEDNIDAESLSGGRNAQDTATPQQAEADCQSRTEQPNRTFTFRFLTMKARTKFQHKVVAANRRLLPITEKQTEWAFRHTVGHYAFRTPSGQTTCLDCGYRWNETKTKHCHCPNCHAKLTLKDTLCRKTDEKSYFSVITTQDGFQVQRIFRMTVYYHKSRKARTDVCEVARYWLDENGKTALTALQRAMGRYLDCFLYGSGLELRNDNYVYKYIADCYVYPRYTSIPKLRRNGLKGSFADIAPQKLMKALLSDSRVETILKSGRKRDLKYFIDHPQDLDFCWPSYKIVLRQKYRIKDMGIWTDYLRMLDRCGKDLHNAHYVCPADLKAEHDKYQNKVRILQEQKKRMEQMKRARENEARFRELKGKFFGLEFTDGTIVVRVLDSVEAYYDEGNALHHCVGQYEYYLKPNTLVFSARIENKRVETVELSLETFKVLQSRGLCNKNTKYHKRIMNLVHKNIALVRKRMTA